MARHVRRHLTERGFNLVAASRRPIPPFKNEATIRTILYDEESFPERVQNFDAVLHLVGNGKQTAQNSYHSSNVQTTNKIIRICQTANIKRIIYMSGLGVSPDSTLGYFISKYNAEQAIINSGIEYTIFRPSYIIGPDDLLTRNLQKQILSGRITIPGSGKYRMQPVSIKDVIKVLEMAVLGELPNRTLDLVGPRTISFLEYIRALAGPGTTISHTDIEAAYRQAITDTNPAYEVDDLCIMIAGFTGNHTDIHQATGIEFSDFLKTGICP